VSLLYSLYASESDHHVIKRDSNRVPRSASAASTAAAELGTVAPNKLEGGQRSEASSEPECLNSEFQFDRVSLGKSLVSTLADSSMVAPKQTKLLC
jgi:hypothetical protein